MTNLIASIPNTTSFLKSNFGDRKVSEVDGNVDLLIVEHFDCPLENAYQFLRSTGYLGNTADDVEDFAFFEKEKRIEEIVHFRNRRARLRLIRKILDKKSTRFLKSFLKQIELLSRTLQTPDITKNDWEYMNLNVVKWWSEIPSEQKGFTDQMKQFSIYDLEPAVKEILNSRG